MCPWLDLTTRSNRGERERKAFLGEEELEQQYRHRSISSSSSSLQHQQTSGRTVVGRYAYVKVRSRSMYSTCRYGVVVTF